MTKSTLKKFGRFVVVFLGLVGFFYLTPLMLDTISTFVDPSVLPFIRFLLRFCFSLLIVLTLREWVDEHIAKGRFKRNLKFYLHSVVRLVYFVLVIIIAIASLGAPLGSFVTFLGIASAGLAVALQQPLLNIVGYIFILASNLYSKGDYIRISNHIGRVEELNFMHTRIVEYTEDGLPKGMYTSIPNSDVLTNAVVNFNRPTPPVAARFTVSLTYESNIDKAMKKIRKIIEEEWTAYINHVKRRKGEEDLNYLEQRKYFLVTDFASSSINITVVFKVPFEHYASLKTNLVNAVFKHLPEKDIEIAYPHIKLLLKDPSLFKKVGK